MKKRVPIGVLGRVLRTYWDEMFILVICNMIWLVAQLLVVTGPPATAALFVVTNRLARGQVAKVKDFWAAAKGLFLAGWKWGGLNILIIVIMVNAAYVYSLGVVPGSLGPTLMLLSLILLAGWLFTQLFAFPFWLEQSDRRIVLALRNGVVVQAHNLGLSGVAFLLTAAVAVATRYFPPLLALGAPALLALMGNAVVVAQIDALRGDDEPPARP